MRVAQQLQLLFLLGVYPNAEWLQMPMLARKLSSHLEQGIQDINAKIRTNADANCDKAAAKSQVNFAGLFVSQACMVPDTVKFID